MVFGKNPTNAKGRAYPSAKAVNTGKYTYGGCVKVYPTAIPINGAVQGLAIKTAKESFVGKDAILAHVPEYARVGARVKERGIVREHCDIYCGDELVGVSTSGTHSPTLGYGICMLRIKRAFVGSELTADVRGHKIALETVNLPFYRR